MFHWCWIGWTPWRRKKTRMNNYGKRCIFVSKTARAWFCPLPDFRTRDGFFWLKIVVYVNVGMSTAVDGFSKPKLLWCLERGLKQSPIPPNGRFWVRWFDRLSWLRFLVTMLCFFRVCVYCGFNYAYLVLFIDFRENSSDALCILNLGQKRLNLKYYKHPVRFFSHQTRH